MRKIITTIILSLSFVINVNAMTIKDIDDANLSTKDKNTIVTFVNAMEKIYFSNPTKFFSVKEKLDNIYLKLYKAWKKETKTYKLVEEIEMNLDISKFDWIVKKIDILNNNISTQVYNINQAENDLKLRKKIWDNQISSLELNMPFNNITFDNSENSFDENKFREFISNFKNWKLEDNMKILETDAQLYNPMISFFSVWEYDFWYKKWDDWIYYLSANIWWDLPTFNINLMKKIWDNIYRFSYPTSFYISWKESEDYKYNYLFYNNNTLDESDDIIIKKSVSTSLWYYNVFWSKSDDLWNEMLNFFNNKWANTDFDTKLQEFKDSVNQVDEVDISLKSLNNEYVPWNTYGKTADWKIFYIQNSWDKIQVVWADAKTIKIIDFMWWDYYAKDKNHVYNMWEKLSWADPKTFEIAWKWLIKDKNNAYGWIFKVPNADVASIEELDNFYLKDKNNVYYFNNNSIDIISWADANSFVVEDYNSWKAKDKNSTYLNWKKQ